MRYKKIYIFLTILILLSMILNYLNPNKAEGSLEWSPELNTVNS